MTEGCDNAEILAVFSEARIYEQKAEDLYSHLGDLIRAQWSSITETRSVTALAELLGVERTFLYKVQNGQKWI
jgi:hypothetical protein